MSDYRQSYTLPLPRSSTARLTMSLGEIRSIRLRASVESRKRINEWSR